MRLGRVARLCSTTTVFNSVGGKPAMLRACYDVARVGDDPVPLPQRLSPLAVRDEPDQRRMIVLYSGVIAGIGDCGSCTAWSIPHSIATRSRP